MSSISIIGLGNMASALAGRALAGGNDVEIIGRDPAKAKEHLGCVDVSLVAERYQPGQALSGPAKQPPDLQAEVSALRHHPHLAGWHGTPAQLQGGRVIHHAHAVWPEQPRAA